MDDFFSLVKGGWLSAERLCPSGTSENSPAIYRWVFKNQRSPIGTAEIAVNRHAGTTNVVPSGRTGELSWTRYRRRTTCINQNRQPFTRPSGTSMVFASPSDESLGYYHKIPPGHKPASKNSSG